MQMTVVTVVTALPWLRKRSHPSHFHFSLHFQVKDSRTIEQTLPGSSQSDGQCFELDQGTEVKVVKVLKDGLLPLFVVDGTSTRLHRYPSPSRSVCEKS